MSSDPKELAKMVVDRFTVRAGQRIVGGKSYYPNMLRVRLNRYAAYKLMQDLLNALERTEGHADAPIDINPFFGELVREEPES